MFLFNYALIYCNYGYMVKDYIMRNKGPRAVSLMMPNYMHLQCLNIALNSSFANPASFN